MTQNKFAPTQRLCVTSESLKCGNWGKTVSLIHYTWKVWCPSYKSFDDSLNAIYMTRITQAAVDKRSWCPSIFRVSVKFLTKLPDNLQYESSKALRSPPCWVDAQYMSVVDCLRFGTDRLPETSVINYQHTVVQPRRAKTSPLPRQMP